MSFGCKDMIFYVYLILFGTKREESRFYTFFMLIRKTVSLLLKQTSHSNTFVFISPDDCSIFNISPKTSSQ